jgi:hypothetical protein
MQQASIVTFPARRHHHDQLVAGCEEVAPAFAAVTAADRPGAGLVEAGVS